MLVAPSLSQSVTASGSKPDEFQCTVACDRSAMSFTQRGFRRRPGADDDANGVGSKSGYGWNNVGVTQWNFPGNWICRQRFAL
jgi:hypothetical protein